MLTKMPCTISDFYNFSLKKKPRQTDSNFWIDTRTIFCVPVTDMKDSQKWELAGTTTVTAEWLQWAYLGLHPRYAHCNRSGAAYVHKVQGRWHLKMELWSKGSYTKIQNGKKTPSLKKLCKKVTFQLDNNPKHTPEITKEFWRSKVKTVKKAPRYESNGTPLGYFKVEERITRTLQQWAAELNSLWRMTHYLSTGM